MANILLNAKRAEKHPLEMMLIGIFYSSISILLGSQIFPEYSSMIIVVFTVFSCLYLVQLAIKIEEKKEKNYISEEHILVEHFDLLKLLFFLFLGFVISFAFWTIVLPQDKVSFMFSLQEQVIEGVRTMATTGNSISNSGILGVIISNNLKVLFICLILSLFYGAGAIFVIVWNASIMGFVMGSLIKSKGLLSIPVVITKFSLHGIPEMLSYIIIVLAGGIIYTSIVRKDILDQNKQKKIITDVITLIAISIILITLAALIEVFISSAI